MVCSYCQALNAADDHRCNRCGRRLSGSANDTTDLPVAQVKGALAAAPARQGRDQASAEIERSPQGRLAFGQGHSNVIPFESFTGARPAERPAPSPISSAPAAGRPAARRPATDPLRRPQDQRSLDFATAPKTGRTLKTTVEAVIYCDNPVATPTHRMLAAALDASLAVIAFGLFLLTFHFMGGQFVLNKQTAPCFGAAYLLIQLFYGALYVLTNGETSGMRWTHMRFSNFDGFRPDRIQRLLRFAGTCLSFCTFGMGLLWALVDEESLTWQDHISKTFPTLRESETNFVRRRQ